MAKSIAANASFTPLAELLSRITLSALDVVNAAREVLVQIENFKKFSNYIEEMIIIFKELSRSNVDDSEALRNALDVLNKELKVVNHLALECKTRNKVYLLLSSRKILNHLEHSTKKISQALELISLASLDVPLDASTKVNKLHKDMLDNKYHAAEAEEEILEKIESGIEKKNLEKCYANNLFVCMAEAVGVSKEQSAIRKEFEDLKREIEDAKREMDIAEATRIEQVIALIEKADAAATSYEEKEKRYSNKRNSLSRQPLEPLQSFYCPITQAVMDDPVEISSGRTFERSAIERWFADGNKSCPLTCVPLDNVIVRPNRTLRRSIEEWKERNNMIRVVSIKPKLQSDDEEEVLQSLLKLQDLCTEQELHREWMELEDYISILVGLLSAKNREIRTHALAILCILAKDSNENKEKISKVDHALKSIVRSLARQIGEGKLALQLLLQLSGSNGLRDGIGKTQGCIFLLVTMLNCDDAEASKDAKEILDNLSFLDQNVIEMAKANYFKPLVRLLSSGPEEVRMKMAETLSDIELTDHGKISLFKDGALRPLLWLLSDDDLEMKTVAVRALQNLSNVPQNGLQMIREGATVPLFDILYRHSLSSPSLREQVALIVMNLAVSTNAQEADDEQISLMESDEDIFKLFSLVSLTGPDIQKNILQAFCAMSQSPSGPDIRAKLRQLSAVQVLVHLCESNNHPVRASAVKLFCCLTVDGDDSTFQEHVGQRYIETLLRIIKTSNDEKEITAAMGIVSNLPQDPQMTQWLLDAGALDIIFQSLTDGNRNAWSKKQITENAAGSLCRFTVSTNQEWQKRVATTGIIPILVQLLGSGTSLAKQNAAISLKQFSESSTALSKPVKKPGAFMCCLAAPETACPVHKGICTVESSFCLLEANALVQLVRILGEKDFGPCEASLDAILTLIEGERLQSGCKVLAEANAIRPIIKLLSSSSEKLQEKALRALERIFRLVEFKQAYESSAKIPLVDITQRGSSGMKPLAAKVLAQLNVLGEQSSYF